MEGWLSPSTANHTKPKMRMWLTALALEIPDHDIKNRWRRVSEMISDSTG